MGGKNTKPRWIPKKGQQAKLSGGEISKYYVPTELLKKGTNVTVVENFKMFKSNPREPDVYLTRVSHQGGGGFETYLMADLQKK